MLTLLWRGRLSSCNYACGYCPFAKRRDTRAALVQDAADLARFVAWAGAQRRALRVLFTPWGEALIRRHYRAAMVALAQMPHVDQVSIQTNLSGPLAWLEDAPRAKLSLWCTWHPGEAALERFADRCARLHALGVAFSAGIVARREHLDAIDALRAALPAGTPLWLNAYDRAGPGYYDAATLARLEAIDPWFRYDVAPPPSRGRPCGAGEDALSVDADGDLRRCHFIPTRLGNLYADDLDALLAPRPCSRLRCECFIGYAHRRDLPIREAFAHGGLARIALRVVPVAGTAAGC